MAQVAVSTPEQVDPTFAKTASRRRSLHEKRAALVGEGLKAQNSAAHGELTRLRTELLSVEGELRGVEADYSQQWWDATDAAARKLTAGASYKSLVREAAASLAAHLEAWLPLAAVINEAGEHGVRLPPPPAGVARQLAEAKAWVRKQVHEGALAAEDLPPPLRPLLASNGS